MKPLAIDLYCGLGGWTEGLLAEGYYVVDFDLERHVYGEHRYPGQLVLQDVLTLHGRQFKDAALIVASPPCQEFSYMAMPWTRAKALASDYRTGQRNVGDLCALFNACFRIRAEAEWAAGHRIPLVVENVRGAQEWVGRAAAKYGSFFLWGDIPPLLPEATAAIKQAGISGIRKNGKGARWFQDGAARSGSKLPARKAASAMIAKIPFPLASHIARVYYPQQRRAECTVSSATTLSAA